MPVSMNPAARYVTQQNFYSGNVIGRPLSDRRITFYQKQGKYGPYRPKPKRPARKNLLAELLKSFT